jgi:carbon monoxide dehydrogenase subunit G
MQHTTSVTVEAPAERVWAVLSDIAGWPHWTPTVTAIRTDSPQLALGARVTVTQPGRRPTEYLVDEYADGTSFRWSRDRGGVLQVADHAVTPIDATHCTVTVSFAMTGPLGSLLAGLGASTIRRMVEQEAASLKREAETARQPGGAG